MPDEGGVVRWAVDWLSGQQLDSGGFASEVSDSIEPFTPDRLHYHTFFTSIILVCLQNVDDADSIIRPGIKFLKKQQSPQGSWNYWDRNSQMAVKYRFPDDLDDTAYALLALSIHDPAGLSGQDLALLAGLLITNEIKPGGPYRTWLVDKSLYRQWGDVDLAVNANIGGLLNHHGLEMPDLQNYVKTELDKRRPTSLYYQSPIPIIYFLSRWYEGPEISRLFKEHTHRLTAKNVAELAMLLTIGCRVGASPSTLRRLYKLLLESRQRGHWPAAVFYTELVSQGQACYTGSPALTTALALEAITAYRRRAGHAPTPKASAQMKPVKLSPKGLTSPMRKQYLQMAKLITDQDKDHQITDMSGLTAAAYGQQIDANTRMNLNTGSLNGWIAYKYYDDFYDDEAEPAELALANYAHRQTISYFRQALPDNAAFQAYVPAVLDKMDAANYWEVRQARGHVDKQLLSYKLPDYGSLSKLADRSWGHTLAATGTLLASGYALDSPEVKKLHRFFKHYIIARQLNDDAHDVFDDLSRGHLSAATVMLLRSYSPEGPLDIEAERQALQIHFWQHTIQELARQIYLHLEKASQALCSTGMTEPVAFQGWLDRLAEATRRAEQGSRQTKSFINTFKKFNY